MGLDRKFKAEQKTEKTLRAALRKKKLWFLV